MNIMKKEQTKAKPRRISEVYFCSKANFGISLMRLTK